MDNKKGIVFKAISKKNITLFIVFLVFIMGILSYISLPKQQYPVIQLPMVIITTVYPGASAEDVEELISKKIEDKCMEADGFDNVRSDSYNSVSVVKLSFNRDLSAEQLEASMDDLRNEIMDLKETELPSGVSALNYNDDAFETSGLIIAFTADNETNEELVQRAESLKDELIGMQGVSKVSVEGEIERQIKVKIDIDKLNHTNVSLAELSSIIGYQNSTVPVGTIEFPDDEIYINTSGKIENIEELRNIIISINADTGAVVKLKDVADVSFTEDEDSKNYKFNGKPSVILTLNFKDDVNVLKIGKEVMAKVEKYKQVIPDNVYMDNVIYLPDDVSSSINDFIVNLIESVIIVLAVVMIGMSIRNGTIVSVVIPLAIFASFICMKAFGVDIQFVSLASLVIALGMLVSNAIVVSDAIQVRIDNDEERLWACVNGAKEVAYPVLTSTLTTVVIFAVFYVLPGTIKSFVFSLPTVVISALIASYIISMLVTPVMCFMLMKKSKPKRNGKGILRSFFTKLLNSCLKHGFITCCLSIAAVVLSALLMSKINLELVPNSDKMLLDITITTNNFYDIRKSRNAVDNAVEILSSQDEVEYFLSSAGGRIPKYEFTTMPGVDSTYIGNIVAKINIDNSVNAENKAEYCEYLSNMLSSKIPSCHIVVKEMGIIPNSSEPVQVNILGDDFDKIDTAAVSAETLLKGLNSAKDVYSDRKLKTYDYYIDIKNDLLNSNGLTKAEVQNELNIAMMGREATKFRQNNKEYPVIIQTDIKTASKLNDLQIKSSITANKHKLSQVADIGIREGYSAVSRYNGKRCVTISASTKNGASAIETQMQFKKLLENEKFDDSISFVFEGDNDMFTEIMQSLGIGSAIGTMLVFLILYVQFYSFKKSFIVLMSVPFSIIGSAVGLYLTGQNLSMFAILGIISLIGVVVNNAIVLVDYIDGEIKNGSLVIDACRTAVDMRFRPIMLSTVTTVLGLLPLALFGNILFKGLSIAFMSGLSTSLLFTLVVIPVMYNVLFRKQDKLNNNKQDISLNS